MSTVADIFDDPLDFPDLIALAEIEASTDWEMEFVSGLSERYDRYEDDMFLSEKQLETLKKIAKVDD